ncbi:hypothetical protein NTE_00903 [Candidatus Nitrososphaera evergladensis SR1]|uniref:Uncharacterized protein n=2 Tax=Nitrososphaera TaxID=497726 RepID=A0A075MUJ0_9ARCH|nr:hypothetical protein NTE_00903 [Candidatus Nitrososphaera evergladensis SR1]
MSRVGNEKDKWTKRFMAAAIVQGAIVAGLTIFLLLSQISFLKPEISRVIAGGGAGTWFTFGYVMYIIIGVIGVAVSALFYHYLENVVGKRMQKGADVLAWVHLILMNIGTVATMGMLMYAGYIGGASMLPQSVGGKGYNAGQAHEILAPFVEPISATVIMIVIGVIAGGAGFLLTYSSTSSGRESFSERRRGKGATEAA